MKDAIKDIIDKHGTDDARYFLITSGREASTKIDFTDGFKTTQDFTNAVNTVQRPEGTPDLKKALEQAMKLFEDAPPPPDAKKILVVLNDQKSVNYPQVLSASAKRLQDENILVLPIAFGSLADLDELTRLAPSKGVVIKIGDDEDGAAIAEKIMNDGVKGKYYYCCCLMLSSSFVYVGFSCCCRCPCYCRRTGYYPCSLAFSPSHRTNFFNGNLEF